MAWDTLPPLFPDFAAPARWLGLLQGHARLLEEAEPRQRVTSTPPAERIRRHFAESLEILRIALAAGAQPPFADIGPGGGFPGLVIACVLPDAAVHLVEPLRKRAALLAEMAAALGLANVTVAAQRAEEAGRGPLRDACGTVFARAVAQLRVLYEYTAPLCRDGGLLVMPKGSALDEELTTAVSAARILAVGSPEVIAMRPEVGGLRIVLARKHGPTPAPYPRRPGFPERRPL